MGQFSCITTVSGFQNKGSFYQINSVDYRIRGHFSEGNSVDFKITGGFQRSIIGVKYVVL